MDTRPLIRVDGPILIFGGPYSNLAATAAVLADAQAMLMKYDEAITMVEKGEPLNPLFDDVARLRIVRSNLREVVPALMAGPCPICRYGLAKPQSAVA